MLKRILILIILFCVCYGLWNIYTTLFGTFKEKKLAKQYAIEYILNKYQLTKDDIEINETSYLAGYGFYQNIVINKRNKDKYYLNIKLDKNGNLYSIYESVKHPSSYFKQK
ncbi:hypothetical protein G3578_07270 [Brevibacillus sp. SYP-B805]|uniref:hypothetical protein n=1 Tax=Brevibacillus sp. SYP-B805 TaxID=1578199 RepID=UPI0013E9B4B2|nr:hypothetical protein [Brevibacillus sp. SYP-B805]NGQ94985.1 hypothetical protein [Brevibacillus sp. SYP-B805]